MSADCPDAPECDCQLCPRCAEWEHWQGWHADEYVDVCPICITPTAWEIQQRAGRSRDSTRPVKRIRRHGHP